MAPIAHEGSPRTGIELAFQISIVDRQMEPRLERLRNVDDPLFCIDADVGKIPFANRSVYSRLWIALDFDKVFIQINFPQDAIPSNDAMHRQGVEEFVRENAA